MTKPADVTAKAREQRISEIAQRPISGGASTGEQPPRGITDLYEEGDENPNNVHFAYLAHPCGPSAPKALDSLLPSREEAERIIQQAYGSELGAECSSPLVESAPTQAADTASAPQKGGK